MGFTLPKLGAGGQGLPGVLQTVLGGTQVLGDTFTQGFNLWKGLAGAERLAGLGRKYSSAFTGETTPEMSPEEVEYRRSQSPLYQLQQSEGDFKESFAKVLETLQGGKANLEAGKQEALEQYDQPEFKRRLSKTEQEAEANRKAVTDSINVARAGAAKAQTDLQATIDASLGRVRTNVAERVGAEVSGVRLASNRSIADSVQALRAAGASDADIAVHVQQAKETTSQKIAETWSKGITQVSDKLAEISVAGMTNMSNLLQSVQSLNANLAGVEAAAGETQNAANIAVAKLQAGREADLSGLIWKATETNAVLESQLAATQFEGAREVAAFDQMYADGLQMALNLQFESDAEAIRMWAGN